MRTFCSAKDCHIFLTSHYLLKKYAKDSHIFPIKNNSVHVIYNPVHIYILKDVVRLTTGAWLLGQKLVSLA